MGMIWLHRPRLRCLFLQILERWPTSLERIAPGKVAYYHRKHHRGQVICVWCCRWTFPSCSKQRKSLLGQKCTPPSQKILSVVENRLTYFHRTPCRSLQVWSHLCCTKTEPWWKSLLRCIPVIFFLDLHPLRLRVHWQLSHLICKFNKPHSSVPSESSFLRLLGNYTEKGLSSLPTVVNKSFIFDFWIIERTTYYSQWR